MTWRQYAGNFDNPINPEYEQEARLVDQSRAGSERAFSALLARYQQPVFRLIFYLVGDDEEARDLTRIAIKNALLHMPSVPAGFSIRPWLLRVAVLVALDAVRERSETPQQLLASLQLPAPAAAPRIVDADPAESDTMELGVTRMETLAHRPETAIADAWDTLPVDVERELIRRLLSGLPEGDAELLALGVVGQVPTRDLAALAGTSQRSIRRRVARALILFQSRYYSVRHDALPPAPEEKTLPPAEAATTRLELARRGINEASDRVMRTLQGVRAGFSSTEAQERLQTLRATDIPPAEVAPTAETPRRSVPLTAPAAPSVVDADPTMPLPRAAHDAADDEAFADWTTPVPSMEVPDLATSKTPSIANADQVTELLPRSAHGPPPPNIIPMPPASTPYRATDPAAAMTIPMPAPTEAITTPASPNLAAVTEPLPALSADAATLVRSAPETAPSAAADVAPPADTHSVAGADVTVAATQIPEAPTLVRTDPATTADAATTQRRLPRFGPPPEEVIVGNPHESAAALDMAEESADATEAPILAEEPTDTLILAEAPADSLEPPLADEALPIDAEDMAHDEVEAPPSSEIPMAMPVAALDEADEAVATVPPSTEEATVALDASIPDTAPNEVTFDEVDAALTPLMAASDAETADEVSAAIDEAPAAVVISDDPSLAAMPDTEAERPLIDVVDESLVDEAAQPDSTAVAAFADTDTAGEATIGATSAADDFATDQADALPLIEEDTEAAAIEGVYDADEPVAEQDTNDALPLEAEMTLPSEATAPDLDETVAPEEATEVESQATLHDPEADAKDEEEPPPAPSVVAIERSGTEEAPARSGTLNSTVVLQPLARADYVNRHRPSWLDVADLGSLPGVALDPDAERDAPPSSAEPSVPLMGALHVAAQDVAPEQVGDIPATSTEQGMDLADLADLAAPTPLLNPDEATDVEAPRAPRPPTRPLPKLDRDMIDPPRER